MTAFVVRWGLSVPMPPSVPGTAWCVLSTEHMDALFALEQRAQEMPWTPGALLEELHHPEALVVGAFVDENLCAYVALRRLGDELNVLNIAVDPGVRRRGVASALLGLGQRVLDLCPAWTLWLEVRESNAAAIALYRTCGFVEMSRRRGYYRPKPGTTQREDALVMRFSSSSGIDAGGADSAAAPPVESA